MLGEADQLNRKEYTKSHDNLKTIYINTLADVEEMIHSHIVHLH